MTVSTRTAESVARELAKPRGYMVTRYWVMDEAGLYFAGDDEFTYEQDDALEFSDEGEAEEVAAAYHGSTVERFQRWSQYPDVGTADHALAEALNYVRHWRRDRDDNCAPTLESLNHVEAVLRNAIASAA